MTWDNLNHLTFAQWVELRDACIKHIAAVPEELRAELIVRYGHKLREYDPRFRFAEEKRAA